MLGALALCLAASIASTAHAAPAIQTIEAEVGGKTKPKFHKKKFRRTSVEVETTTADAADPSGIPPKATQARIKFDRKNIRFDTRAVHGCDPATIAGTTTEAAKAACGAKVGHGSAIAALPFGPGGTRANYPVVVTAFNRSDAKGILLHSRVDSLATTTVLTGTLRGAKLTVQVPPLGGGVGAIAQFRTKVKAKDYVEARCKRKRFKTKAVFTFSDAPQATAADHQRCKRKPSKRGRHHR
jgi:hypothetical protein